MTCCSLVAVNPAVGERREKQEAGDGEVMGRDSLATSGEKPPSMTGFVDPIPRCQFLPIRCPGA